MGLPITASWKPWMPRYPARFSSCRLVTTAGRLCPQPVNLHLQEEWVVPDHLDHQRQCQKRENKPPTSPPPTTTLPSPSSREGRGKRTGGCPRHRPPASHRLESWGRLSAFASVCQTDGGTSPPPSLLHLQSPTALSFASRKRLWTIQPVIATIKENNIKKKELSSIQNVK